jgi:hypothetical protein
MRISVGARCGPNDRDIQAAMEIAVEAWRVDLSVPDVVIAPGAPPADYGYVPPYEDGNGVYVACSWPFEPALAVTVATHTPDGQMLDADIVINGRQMLALLEEGAAPSNDHDLASVLAHEMGHVLGLDESNRPAATMWPTTMTGDTRQRTLAPDDEAGVLALYEDANIRLETYGCAVSRPSNRGAPLLLGELLFAVAAALGVRRRRRRRRESATPRPVARTSAPTSRL